MPAKLHFLNVGSGDCTIIHFPERVKNGSTIPERIMMVDIHHHDDHDDYEHVIDYYKENFRDSYSNKLKPIFRFVCTHPHCDHIKGISKLFNENDINIQNFWDLNHEFEPEDFEGYDEHEDDWKTYKEKSSPSLSVPKSIITSRESERCDFWNEDGDNIVILAPSNKLIYDAHYDEDGKKRDIIQIDEMSYALLINIGSTKVVLAGDGKERTWNDIYENCFEDISDCHLLKAGHHGQESAFHKDAVSLMNPNHIIFSNSEECDKEYGAEKLYRKACPGCLIHKTHELGTIIAECDFSGGITVKTN